MEITNSTDSVLGNRLPKLSILSQEDSVEGLKMKIKELNSDISVLKRLVYMLNVELELRDSGYRENDNKPKVLDPEATDNLFFKSDIKLIEPLLQAFEQTKEEKDELLASYKLSFDEFAHRCKETVLENDMLRRQLHDTKTKAESTFIEWKKLHETFQLLEEQNQLLTRQSKLFQNRIRSLESAYQKTLRQLEDDKKELYEKLETTKTELLLLKGRQSVYSDVKTQSPGFSDHQCELNIYSSVMVELKNLSSELKIQHANEVRMLKAQIKTLESQKCDLEIRLTAASSERDHLQGYVSAIETETRKMNFQFEDLKQELQSAKKDQEDARKYVIKCMAFVRELMTYVGHSSNAGNE